MVNALGILWMSPGNSYFKKDKIEEIIIEYAQRFEQLHVLSPAALAKHTYLAMGYDDTKAGRKARRNTNRLRNHAQRAIQKNHLGNVRIVEWEEIENDQQYEQASTYIMRLYKNHAQFRRDARQTTKEVLESKTGDAVSSAQIDEAIQYLLAELAYIWGASQIHSTKNASYIYHHKWPILDKLIDGTYTGFNSNDIIFTLNEL